MKWDGSGGGGRGGVEKEKLLETMKGSWLERRDGVQGYRLIDAFPQDPSRSPEFINGRGTQQLFRAEIGKSSERSQIVNILGFVDREAKLKLLL